MTNPHTIIAITKAAPGQETNLRAAQEKLVGETLLETGCLRYELHQSCDDSHVLIFVETWASEALWRDHMEGEALQRFRASGASSLIEEFTLHRLQQVGSLLPS